MSCSDRHLPASEGRAGASARREHERRKAAREQRVRGKHPLLGGLLLSVTDAPQHEQAWARGAAGEERVAEVLERRCDDRVRLLHDRRMPGSRANVDHLAVASSGVWVIDAKRYRGSVEVRKPLFGSRKLLVAGRDRTKLIGGLAKQVAAVQDALREADCGVPVTGVLCFVDADLPLLGTLRFDDVLLLTPGRLAKRLNAPGPLTGPQATVVVAALAQRFPAA